jgi:hypothetical protein
MSNRNAIIVNRTDKFGKSRTETRRRDADAPNFAITTHPRKNASKLFIDLPTGESVTLNGHQIQTLRRMLDKHYDNA